MIVVTGATGHVGHLVAEAVAARSQPMRLIVRDPARAPALADAEVAVADYGDRAALSAALDEGDCVFMVSVHALPERRLALHRSFIETAAARRVGQIVYLSFLGAGSDATFVHARSHGATEAMLEHCGVPYSAIRNGLYADEIPGWFDAGGVCRVPAGQGRVSFSYRPELGEAIATTLTEAGHERRVYNVTGPESVTLARLSEIACEVTGCAYRYEPPDRETWRAERLARGRSQEELDVVLSSFDAIRGGELDVVTDDYRAITGREPLTISEIIEQRLDEMPLR